MVEMEYGTFDDAQVKGYIEKLHKKVHWLLLYKDPKMAAEYNSVNYDKYYTFLMREMNGCNALLRYPVAMVQVMSILEAAYLETKSSKFDFPAYRKLILDAQNLIDNIGKQKV